MSDPHDPNSADLDRLLADAAAATATERAPSDFTSRVMAEIEATAAPVPRAAWRRSTPWAAAAAAAVLVGIGAFVVGRETGKGAIDKDAQVAGRLADGVWKEKAKSDVAKNPADELSTLNSVGYIRDGDAGTKPPAPVFRITEPEGSVAPASAAPSVLTIQRPAADKKPGVGFLDDEERRANLEELALRAAVDDAKAAGKSADDRSEVKDAVDGYRPAEPAIPSMLAGRFPRSSNGRFYAVIDARLDALGLSTFASSAGAPREITLALDPVLSDGRADANRELEKKTHDRAETPAPATAVTGGAALESSPPAAKAPAREAGPAGAPGAPASRPDGSFAKGYVARRVVLPVARAEELLASLSARPAAAARPLVLGYSGALVAVSGPVTPPQAGHREDDARRKDLASALAAGEEKARSRVDANGVGGGGAADVPRAAAGTETRDALGRTQVEIVLYTLEK